MPDTPSNTAAGIPTDKDSSSTDEVLRAKIALETARINWLDLQTFFARGQVVMVSAELDLVDVAIGLTHDDKQAFDEWLKSDRVSYVSDSLAQQWFDCKKELWSVVVAPWVIVQDKD